MQSSPDPEPSLFIPEDQVNPVSFVDLLHDPSFSPTLHNPSRSPELPYLPLLHIPLYEPLPIEPLPPDEDGLYDDDASLDRDDALSDDLQSDAEEPGVSQQTTTWRIDHSKGDHKLKGNVVRVPRKRFSPG